MKYEVLIASTFSAIVDKVQKWIDVGWTPQGGVSVATDGKDIIYAQAMIVESD